MIDELSRRKEGFDLAHSAPVTLSDGQTWYVPKPWVALTPVFSDGKAISTWGGLTCGPDLDLLVSAVGSLQGEESLLATMTLGAFLVQRNYDVSDAEMSDLFVWRSGDPESEAMIRQIIDVATGRNGPKASGAGAG